MGVLQLKKGKKVTNTGSDPARGKRNNNPLNIKRTVINWKGEKKDITDPDFEEFESMMWGLRAGLRNMRTHFMKGANTIYMIVSKWAPPSENNTLKYCEFVVSESGYPIDQELTWEKDVMFPVVSAMCKMESNLTLTKELYEEAWENI